jgi:ketosteroid isomerase-like protein
MSEPIRALVLKFVERYNTENSDTYQLYGPEVDWLEMPSGRHGGRDALFAAMKSARVQLANMHLEVLSITADDDAAVLESRWNGVSRDDGSQLSGRVLWLFGYRNGLISREREYVVQEISEEQAALMRAAPYKETWR